MVPTLILRNPSELLSGLGACVQMLPVCVNGRHSNFLLGIWLEEKGP